MLHTEAIMPFLSKMLVESKCGVVYRQTVMHTFSNAVPNEMGLFRFKRTFKW
jgi:hypothetical protein